MYKCYHCNVNFDHKDNTELKQGLCPGCGGTNYINAFKCSICGKYHFPEETYKGICYKCAEAKYTNRLGLRWLDKHKEYFLNLWGIEKVDKDLKDDLIEVLEKDFLSKVDLDTDWNKQLSHLKNYILEDMDVWIEFLKEEKFNG